MKPFDLRWLPCLVNSLLDEIHWLAGERGYQLNVLPAMGWNWGLFSNFTIQWWRIYRGMNETLRLECNYSNQSTNVNISYKIIRGFKLFKQGDYITPSLSKIYRYTYYLNRNFIINVLLKEKLFRYVKLFNTFFPGESTVILRIVLIYR